MLYINDINPTTSLSTTGIQRVFNERDFTSPPRKLSKIVGKLGTIQSNSELIYGVMVSHHIVGYVLLGSILRDNWEVKSVQISPEYRGQGIISEVLSFILQDIKQIVSGSIQNTATKQLYLNFNKKHPNVQLLTVDLNTGEEGVFDYSDPDQYWDGRLNIRVMLRLNPESEIPQTNQE